MNTNSPNSAQKENLVGEVNLFDKVIKKKRELQDLNRQLEFLIFEMVSEYSEELKKWLNNNTENPNFVEFLNMLGGDAKEKISKEIKGTCFDKKSVTYIIRDAMLSTTTNDDIIEKFKGLIGKILNKKDEEIEKRKKFIDGV